MDALSKIARSATPGPGIHVRPRAYGTQGIHEFLRDVMALANAGVEGPRYIVVGLDSDEQGGRRVHAIDAGDFSGKPSYQALANEFIEPALRVRYKPALIDGIRVGVFEIAECGDRPYMMRIDYSEKLRRGDAYKQTRGVTVKMGRRQLQELFALKFRDAVSASDIELGFPGEIIHKQHTLRTTDLGQLPSLLAGSKLEQLISIRNMSQSSGATTRVARLTHARLFGTDSPYVDRSAEQIALEMNDLRAKYGDQDDYFLFEQHGQELQFVVYNQGDEAITDASLNIALPNHGAFHVASRLPRRIVNGHYVDRSPDEIAAYPSVVLRDESVRIATRIGDIPPGRPMPVFATPLRLCAGMDLSGRRFGIRYALHGRNLRAPARGQLRLSFA